MTPDPIHTIREHMKEIRHDIRGHIAIRGRDFMTEPVSAMLGRIRKVAGPRPGHRPAGQEKKGTPFEVALLTENGVNI